MAEKTKKKRAAKASKPAKVPKLGGVRLTRKQSEKRGPGYPFGRKSDGTPRRKPGPRLRSKRASRKPKEVVFRRGLRAKVNAKRKGKKR